MPKCIFPRWRILSVAANKQKPKLGEKLVINAQKLNKKKQKQQAN